MTVDHQVYMHIPEPRKHRHAFGRYDLSSFGNLERPDLPDRLDSLAFNDDHAVPERPVAVAVDQRASHKHFESALRARGLRVRSQTANNLKSQDHASPHSVVFRIHLLLSI